jgi:hypothetical protein
MSAAATMDIGKIFSTKIRYFSREYQKWGESSNYQRNLINNLATCHLSPGALITYIKRVLNSAVSSPNFGRGRMKFPGKAPFGSPAGQKSLHDTGEDLVCPSQ